MHLEETDALIITARFPLPRGDGQRALDLFALIDGELSSAEVETPLLAGTACTITRIGNLAAHVSAAVDRAGKAAPATTANYGGDAAARAYVVDLRLAVLQWLPVDDTGRLHSPPELTVPCDGLLRSAVDVVRSVRRLRPGRHHKEHDNAERHAFCTPACSLSSVKPGLEARFVTPGTHRPARTCPPPLSAICDRRRPVDEPGPFGRPVDARTSGIRVFRDVDSVEDALDAPAPRAMRPTQVPEDGAE